MVAKRRAVDEALEPAALTPGCTGSGLPADHDLHAAAPRRAGRPAARAGPMSERAHDRRGPPRLLTIMGSGETAPTMVKVHRQLLDRVGGGPAVLLDTPYGFQENADDISERGPGLLRGERRPPHRGGVASAHGRRRAGARTRPGRGRRGALRVRRAGQPHLRPAPVAGHAPRRRCSPPKLGRARGASPSPAPPPSRWASPPCPCTRSTRPGSTPRWLAGLDLLGVATGLRAVVIPHYDNAEGGHHDTRYCYLGERRLARMEAGSPTACSCSASTSTPRSCSTSRRAGRRCVGLGG